MAGLLNSMGVDNGFTNWWNERRNAIGGLGMGLASGNTLSEGIALGTQGALQGRQADDAYAIQEQERARREQEIASTSKWLQENYPEFADLPPDQGFALATKMMGEQQDQTTANQRDYLFAKSNGFAGSFADWVGGGGGSTEYGLTPIWGKMPDGSFGYGVQGKDGTFRQVDTGELDPLDPRSLNYEKGYGGSTGKAAGEATAAAPGDIAAGMAALDIIDQIKTSPELGWATGTSAGMGGNAIPGTGRFGFQNLVDQAKSGAFLTAVQEMRGLGALSNAEGSAATQAITRINTALSKEDFLKALADYEAIVQRGIARAQARISGGAQGQQQTAPGGQTSTGLQWSVEP